VLTAGIPVGAANPPKANLSRLIVIGDSLSAGFQNFSLFDSPVAGQSFSYAAQVAKQAQVDLQLPLISFPGIPPALTINNKGVISRGTATGAPENPTRETLNLSVPGFSLLDLLAHPYPGTPATNVIDALSDTILARNKQPGCGPIPTFLAPMHPPGPSVVSELLCAIALRPTTVLVSIGNNDALQSLTLGLAPTDPKVFAAEYALLMAGLASTHASIVVSNIPNVAILPFLTPVPVARDICLARHEPLPASLNDQDFLAPDVTNPQTTVFDLCTAYAVRTRALIAQAQAAVSAYNAIIAAQGAVFGAVVVDVNKLLNGIAATGYVVNGKTLTTQFLGGLFSLDGIHPTNVGYAILANETISQMNNRLNAGIPLISVEQVASTDPLFPLIGLFP
jgi:lysophospholipase L1-like esterase